MKSALSFEFDIQLTCIMDHFKANSIANVIKLILVKR